MIKWLQEHKALLYQVIGYLTVAMVLLTVFIYFKFPWEKLSLFVEAKIEEATSGSLEIKEREIRFPLKMIWTGVTFEPRAVSHPIAIEIDRISVEWTLRRLLQRRLELLWSVQFAEGKGRGRFLAQPTDQGMQYRIQGDLEEVQLEQVFEFVAPNVQGVEGSVKITRIQHDWVGQEFLKGTGEASLEITDSRIKNWDIRFNRILASLSMKSGVAQLDDVLAQGPAVELTGSGNILIRPVLSNSLINFNSRAIIRDPSGPLALLAGSSSRRGGAGTADLTLRGTFRRPTLFLNGIPVWTPSSG